MMKHGRMLLLVLLLLTGCGGDDGAGPGGGGGDNNPPAPVPTTPGVPSGTPVTAIIGAGGGELTSDDGELTLVVPPGALAADTEITIQPITNTAWGGLGRAYRLTPDGLTFAVPVSLTFQVGPDDLTGTAPAFLDVAMQDEEGFWWVLKDRTYDEANATLTCTTPHFSDYSNIRGVQTVPASASVAPGGTVLVIVEICNQVEVADENGVVEALVYSCDTARDLNAQLFNWSVNGIPLGNNTVGRLRIYDFGNHFAFYEAPASAPPGNPVAVSVECRWRSRTDILVSRIAVAADWTGTASATWGNGEQTTATVTWVKTGAAQNLEFYAPWGDVVYTPDTNYGDLCRWLETTPDEASIDKSGQMIIDHSTDPPTVYGYCVRSLSATTCYTCDGWEQPDCQYLDYDLAWFVVNPEDGLTVSPDGRSIVRTWTDANSGVEYAVEFHRNSPPQAP